MNTYRIDEFTGKHSRVLRGATALALVAALTACGGGGTGSTLEDSKPSAPDTTSTGDATYPDDTVYTISDKEPNPAGDGTVELPEEFAEWESQMLEWGKHWGEFVADSSNSFSERLNAVYYDAEWIHYQIADYTGQAEPWTSYARAAEKVYRDSYLEKNNYKVPGYWRFPHGLYEDYVRGSDTALAQIEKLRDNPAYSDPIANSYSMNWYHVRFSREVAYAIHAHIAAEKAGADRQESRVQAFLKMAENHLDQWRRNDYTSPSLADTSYDELQPFMFGLTAHALIDFYEWEKKNGRDPSAYFNDIPGTLAEFAKWMAEEATVVSGTATGEPLWVEDIGGTSGSWNVNGGTGYGAFRQRNVGDPNVSPDLNLLIAPAYAWLYRYTGDEYFRTMSDKLFSSGVMLAATYWNGKIFDQNYRWSFKYVDWRTEGDQMWR